MFWNLILILKLWDIDITDSDDSIFYDHPHNYHHKSCKQSHTSRKNDVFIVLESKTTLPLIMVVIIQNRRKITPKKNLDQFPFLLFTDIYSSSIRTFWVSN